LFDTCRSFSVLFKSNDDDLVVEEGFDFEAGPLLVNGQGWFFVGNQEAQFTGMQAGRYPQFDA